MLIVFTVLCISTYFVSKKGNSSSETELSLVNVEALADSENPFCPNGCVDSGSGCYCYIYYGKWREYHWR